MIWNETKECMPKADMQKLQSARLCKLVDYVYHNVEFYRKKMQAVGLTPADIHGIEDIEKLAEIDLYGAIIGKAYYIGAIDLKQAIEVAK